MAFNAKYFTKKEVTYSETAKELGILNEPTEDIWKNIEVSALYLDRIREYLGFPLTVTSWYRCPELNTAVKGSKTSDHVNGWASDLVSSKHKALVLANLIANTCEDLGIPYDQIIYEQTWVHISFSPKYRRQKLTYRAGTYRQGFIA